MPVISSSYNAPTIFKNYHLSTIYASLFRNVKDVIQKRERLELADGDFIDIDWSYPKDASEKLVVLLHGLEGNAQRPYMLGMTKIFQQQNWTVAAVNLRGCSGEINRLFRSYNAGAQEDLKEIIESILKKDQFDFISIIGFSLGGNLALKYLANGNLPAEVKSAVVISTPCDLHLSLMELQKPKNYMYSSRFVKKLKQQLFLREKLFPDEISFIDIKNCKSLMEVDEIYTSKAHGFKNALDYYEKSSALPDLHKIEVPFLMINAQNDEFLSTTSSPTELAKNQSNFYLETPKYGGHVGFLQKLEFTYSEERALEFINSVL